MPITKSTPSFQLNHNLKKPVNLSVRDIVFIVIILVLLITNIYSGFRYSILNKKLEQTKQTLRIQQLSEKTLNFTQLFIAKVLKAKGEVSFEDRLQLENAVRELKDEGIFNQWQEFVNSQTEEQAQEEVKDLLEMLVNKISY